MEGAGTGSGIAGHLPSRRALIVAGGAPGSGSAAPVDPARRDEAARELDLADAVSAALCAAGIAASGVEIVPASHLSPAATARGEPPDVVVGIGRGAPAALAVATSGGEAAAVVLLAPAVGDEEIALIEESPAVALLTVADPRDRDRLAAAVEAHLASANEGSTVIVEPITGGAQVAGPGGAAAEGPPHFPVASRIAAWVARTLAESPVVEQVAFTTADGWRLHADLVQVPGNLRVPAVALLHSGRSDRSVFTRLARLLARRGFTVLNLDWRGRGRSTGRGRFMELGEGERADAWRDASAAFDFLASLPHVDGDRLGALGIAHGAGHAAAGALADARVKALVLLTGFHPADDEQRARLESGDVEVLYVTGTPHRLTTGAMRSLYERSRGRRTRFLELPEGVLGYQLFDLHPDLEPAIVDWLAEVLRP